MTPDVKHIKQSVRYAEQKLKDAQEQLKDAQEAVKDCLADVAGWKAELLQAETETGDKRKLLQG